MERMHLDSSTHGDIGRAANYCPVAGRTIRLELDGGGDSLSITIILHSEYMQSERKKASSLVGRPSRRHFHMTSSAHVLGCHPKST